MKILLGALAFLALFHPLAAPAHELRPAYLEITERAPGRFDLAWKVPARGEYRLSLTVNYPRDCEEIVPPVETATGDSHVSRWTISCPGGLAGKTFRIDGLTATYTDALARLERADGTMQTELLTPDRPSFEVAVSPSSADTAKTYFLLGVQHILLGPDHLLFVLALLLLIRNLRSLVATITAFTVAHSITLAFSALGLASAPQAPVEALIALSIAMVSSEVVNKERERATQVPFAPWVIAFLFGLLHGFGFGGALREIGLPQRDVPWALLTFNLGVEAGQLLFVALVLLAAKSLKLLLAVDRARTVVPAAYLIGSVAAFWFVQRLAGFAG